MARKKSETPQGDGPSEPQDEASRIPPSDDVRTPETDPVTDPEAVPDVVPETASEVPPATPPENGPRAEPWDPDILAPEPPPAETAEPPTEPRLDTEPDPSRIESEPMTEVAAEAVAEEAAYRPEPQPVPVVETVEEHPEESHEEEGGRSLAGRALLVLGLLLAGAALGIWAAPKIAPRLPAGMAPVAAWLAPGQAETDARIAALQEKIDTGLGAIESRLAALPADDALDARIAAAVAAAETKLSAEIAAARDAAPSVDLTAVNQRIEQFGASLEGQTTELAALKAQIAGTAGQLSEEALGRIDAYRGEVEALRGETGGVRDAVTAFSTRLDEIEARAGREVDAAQAKVNEIQEKAETDLGAADAAAEIAAIRAAVAGGQPFQQPLAALAGPDGAAAPAGLAATAESGVETLSELRESYPDAAHAAIRASIMASAGDGVLARSRAFLEAQVSSRSLAPQTGQGTDAVLSRMEDKLHQDDLDGVLAEAQALPTEAAAAMGDWLAAARARAAALDGIATLDASLNKTN